MIFNIKENLKQLPESPGVYLHKDKLGQVIYVGKAVSLKRRVSQYFQSSKKQDPKVRAMVSHIAEFEYITCKTEMEALILECNLIKKYEPKYNVLLRDDKTYPYIKVTMNEPYPRVLKTRLVSKDGSRYFGPYSDARSVNITVELLSKIFSLKRCSSKEFPEGFKPCLNYHINECVGVCTGNVPREEYLKSIEKILSFLSGKQKPLIQNLTEKMNEASEELNFEEAAKYRDYLMAIKSLGETQRVARANGKDFDIVLSIGRDNNAACLLFMVRDGKLVGRETFNMSSEGFYEDNNRVGEFIKQYYSRWATVPAEIIVEEEPADFELIEEYLESLKEGRKVKILVPKKGQKKALLDMAKVDAVEMVKTLEIKIASAKEKEDNLRAILEKLLGVKKKSYRVESYDISNTNGVDTVGAMVVFDNLKPVKKDYRRFKIRTVQGQNDYASLEEMLRRRFLRAKAGDLGFKTLPDFILMDGGQGQVTSCEKVLGELNISVPVLGMAKDDNHRTRALVNQEGEEVILKENPLLFKYCGTIQEEVHRFAIEYHRNLHRKNTIGSILDNISGIGPKKRTALLTGFKTIDEIKVASVEELMKIEGITEKNAKAIREYFS